MSLPIYEMVVLNPDASHYCRCPMCGHRGSQAPRAGQGWWHNLRCKVKEKHLHCQCYLCSYRFIALIPKETA
jgi:hypothetical protein